MTGQPDGLLTVMVTGATRGIGLEISKELLADGYRVLGVARRDSTCWQALAVSVPDRTELLLCDLGTREGQDVACARLLRTGGDLHALVNNAGMAVHGLHAVTARAAIDEMIGLNLTATMLLSQTAVKVLRKRRAGRIVNITSVAARRPYRGLAAYSATKSAIEGFSRVLAAEAGVWGITVNCVQPGFVPTQMTASLDTATAERVQRRGMLPAATTAHDVATVTRFLLSAAGAPLTAETIRVDGGSAA